MSRYKVMVDDNFHPRDETARYQLGVFETVEAAIAVSKIMVDADLEHSIRPGMTRSAVHPTARLICSADVRQVWANNGLKQLFGRELRPGLPIQPFPTRVARAERGHPDCRSAVVRPR